MKKITSLNPVFMEEKEGAELLENRSIITDITFGKWFGIFVSSLNGFSWGWPGADPKDLLKYISHILLSFCSDAEKIKKAQKMILVFMHQKNLIDFLLDQTEKFESWRDMNMHELKLIEDLEELVACLNKKFQQLQGNSKTILEPIISFSKELEESKRISDIREFIALFKKPMEFHSYICAHEEFDNPFEALKAYREYPHDSKKRKEILDQRIYWHECVCTILDDSGRVSIEGKDYLQDWKSNFHQLSGISAENVAKILGVTFKELYEQVFPSSDEPLRATLVFEPKKGGYEISLTLKEPEEPITLELFDSRRSPKRLVAKKRESEGVRKERNDLQKRLIGMKKTAFFKTGTPDHSSFIHYAKTLYFRGFLRECQDDVAEFGEFLNELRYFAFVAQQFCFAASDVVFPEVLQVEENCTEIINASNPVLIFDPETKGRVIPNTIIINEKQRVQMITGPNQNGKSRYMDSIGLNQIMFQAGWPIFAKKASMSPKTDLKAHYVRSGVGISGESRFSHECQRMRVVFEEMNGSYPLLLIDEPYTGTNYIDSEILLKEVLQACSDENISVFLTTHFHGLIDFVSGLPNGKNLHCVVSDKGEFTYQIREGSSTKSNALSVAETAGVRLNQIKDTIKKIKSDPPLIPATGNEEENGGG